MLFIWIIPGFRDTIHFAFTCLTHLLVLLIVWGWYRNSWLKLTISYIQTVLNSILIATRVEQLNSSLVIKYNGTSNQTKQILRHD